MYTHYNATRSSQGPFVGYFRLAVAAAARVLFLYRYRRVGIIARDTYFIAGVSLSEPEPESSLGADIKLDRVCQRRPGCRSQLSLSPRSVYQKLIARMIYIVLDLWIHTSYETVRRTAPICKSNSMRAARTLLHVKDDAKARCVLKTWNEIPGVILESASISNICRVSSITMENACMHYIKGSEPSLVPFVAPSPDLAAYSVHFVGSNTFRDWCGRLRTTMMHQNTQA